MATTRTHGPVVAGIDFSKGSASAVEYAVAEAVRHDRPLELLYAVDPKAAPPTCLALNVQEIREEAEGELANQRNTIQEDYPGLEVTTRFVQAAPTEALVEASARASMLVLGSRGHGGFGELLLGSVAWRVTSRAPGPVVLVRPTEFPGPVAAGPVVVGVDGSASSEDAIRFAFEEAQARGKKLIPVNVWTLLRPDGLAIGRDWPSENADWEEQARSDANRILSESLAGITEQYPDVTVTRMVSHGLNVPQTLLEVASAKGADLVVVGTRGRHALAGLVMGAVGVQLSHHADRAIAIVRSGAADGD